MTTFRFRLLSVENEKNCTNDINELFLVGFSFVRRSKFWFQSFRFCFYVVFDRFRLRIFRIQLAAAMELQILVQKMLNLSPFVVWKISKQ